MKSSYKDQCIFSIFDKKPKFLLDLEEEKKQDSFELDHALEDDFREAPKFTPNHFLQEENPYSRIHKTYDTVGKNVKSNSNYTKSVETKEQSDSDDFEII